MTRLMRRFRKMEKYSDKKLIAIIGSLYLTFLIILYGVIAITDRIGLV